MRVAKSERPTTVQEVLEEALERGAREADPREVAAADTRLDELLEKVEVAGPSAAPAADAAPVPARAAASFGGVAMRTAQPVSIAGVEVTLRARGVADTVVAALAPGVSRDLIKQAIINGDSVIAECVEGEPPLVVGVLQTRVPQELSLKAKKIHLEADEEILIRSGRGAMRIRQDGDIEMVGSRISQMSRGLFRLVGRVLRLN